MRKQDKYFFNGVAVAAGIVGLIDYFQQKEKLKRIGQKMTWENYNGLQAFKKITVFGIVGGIVGNEVYKWEFGEESENEYRLIVTNMLDDFDTVKSRKLKYDFNSLEGIIFGIKTATEHKLKIMKIIDDKCAKYNRTDFNFYQAYYSKETGKIEYELLSLIKPT